MKNGTVVLEVDAGTLKKHDKKGVVTDLSATSLPNHAVTVIGWKGGNWIVRNSWGKDRVPKQLPEDLNCVKRGKNDCKVEWETWTGDPEDPGFVLLPKHFPALHSKDPSPWIVVDLGLM